MKKQEIYISSIETKMKIFAPEDKEEERYEKQLLKKLSKKQRSEYLKLKGLSQ